MGEFLKLNRNLKLRTLTVFLVVLLGSSVGPNMTIYYVKYFGPVITGILLVIVASSGFVAGLIGGYLADKWGRKPVMLLASALIIAGYFLAMLMNAPWYVNPFMTFFGFLLAQVGSSFADPAQQAMMIDSSTLENRTFVYSLIYWIINVGVMIGAAIGGWFFRDYLFELLIGLLIVAIIEGGIVYFGMSETFTPSVQAKEATLLGGIKTYGSVFVDKRFVLFVIGSIGMTVIFTQPDYYLAAHLGESFKTTHIFGVQIYGQRMLSVMTMTNTAMIVILMGLFTRMTSHFKLTQNVLVGTLMQGGAFAVAFLLHSFWPLMIMAVLLTIGEMINVPASQTIRAEMMNPAKLGAYSGAFAATRPVGMIIASLLVSLSHFVGNYGIALILTLISFAAVALTIKAAKMPATFEITE
ncbi:MAG: MFS transporter [Lactobacillaceae bacterium]|jgi:DHA1 family multidrug resistance protein B-like MFS transporter|nr:MFS transporter [Lactobacillaceae bacterium]